MRRKKTFTLIEILIAVGILLMLVALVVPNLWRARINSNESVAASNLRSLSNALQMYYLDNDEFPEDLSELVSAYSGISYIGPDLIDGSEAGYNLEYNYLNQDTFEINASPRRFGRTGIRHFYINEAGQIHYNDEGPADSSDPIIR